MPKVRSVGPVSVVESGGEDAVDAKVPHVERDGDRYQISNEEPPTPITRASSASPTVRALEIASKKKLHASRAPRRQHRGPEIGSAAFAALLDRSTTTRAHPGNTHHLLF